MMTREMARETNSILLKLFLLPLDKSPEEGAVGSHRLFWNGISQIVSFVKAHFSYKGNQELTENIISE